MRHEIGLDKTSKKFNCPGCGKRRFVRFYNYSLNEYLPQLYGRCDREMKCGYYLGLKEYYNKEKPLFTISKHSPKLEPISYIDVNVISKYARSFRENKFVQFLKLILPANNVKEIILNYFLGTSNHWPGSTIFWQIDNRTRVRSGKILLFDTYSGKRVKTPYPHITWYHKSTKIENFQLGQCLFGLHLVNDNCTKPIAIVESEKTACIMSVLIPEAIWLATGSLHNINERLFQPLYDREIIFYPDASIPNRKGISCYKMWQQKAEQLTQLGFEITISNLLERKATEEQKKAGFDISDYMIAQLKDNKGATDRVATSFVANELYVVSKLVYPEERKLNLLLGINPQLQRLIDEFGLVLAYELGRY
ncbi:MAG: hypothetical protein CMC08_03105 [Flavobacteriaceae bacterium]|nr:hypothetical protein [Flavobacteriaceae bacterium]